MTTIEKTGTRTTRGAVGTRFIYFFGAFGGILFGYDIGVMTGALPFIQADWDLDGQAVTVGWITSGVMFGAIFGGAAAGQLSDRLGRRRMILAAALLFALGSVLCAVVPEDGTWVLIGFRVLLGLAVGAASALVPAYMSEMAPARLRGRLSGINQTMIVSGMLLSYVVDFALRGLPEQVAWRLMLGLAAAPAVVLFIGVLRLPESPRFLVRSGRADEARRVLGWTRPADQVDAELEQIRESARRERRTAGDESWRVLAEPRHRYLLVAGVGVAAFQQFQGANAIFYYIPLIVQQATGTAATDALVWPIVQGVLLVVGSLVFIAVAERFDRRTLLTVGGTVMGLSFVMPALLAVVAPGASPVLILVFLSLYVAFYAFTWAPLTWVIVGEIFPLAIRGRAAGLASSANWVGSFLVGLLFPVMTAAMPQATVFVVFGVICLLGVLFVRTRVPETRGRSLEQIEQLGAAL